MKDCKDCEYFNGYDYSDGTPYEINAGIKTYFNAATREILTDNIVSMLMANDTYQKLSNSMQTFLPSERNGG